RDTTYGVGFRARVGELLAWLAAPRPVLPMHAGALEMVFACGWGSSLQQARRPPGDGAPPGVEAGYGSAAGDIDCGYPLEWVKESSARSWRPTLLLNGVLEVKNLISWPLLATDQHGEDSPDLTLPATRDPTRPLHHTRHTARVLLNQVALGDL